MVDDKRNKPLKQNFFSLKMGTKCIFQNLCFILAQQHLYLCSVNSDKQQLNCNIMPIMINRGKEMLRISPKDSKKIEYSTNQGRSWIARYSGSSSTGAFSDLMDAGKEILGTTDKGLFYSTNDGRSWICRKRGQYELKTDNRMKKQSNEFMEKILNDSAWKELSGDFQWTEQMLEKHKTKVDWKEISKNRNIVQTPAMLEKFRKFIDWKELSNTGCETILTEETLEQYKAYWDWSVLSGNSELKLNYQQIDRFIDLWDWSELINRWREEELYTFDFLERYADKIPSSKLQDSRLWTALVEQREKDLKLEVIA